MWSAIEFKLLHPFHPEPSLSALDRAPLSPRQMMKSWILVRWVARKRRRRRKNKKHGGLPACLPLPSRRWLSSRPVALNESSPRPPGTKVHNKVNVLTVATQHISATVSRCTPQRAPLRTPPLPPRGWWRPPSWEVNGWMEALWRWGKA